MQVEADLLARCARGEERAYRELIERIEKPLINFIVRYVGERHLAEDIFQETFVRVLRTLADYKPEASIATWIFTIARNLCLDHLKAKRRHREVSIDAPATDERGQVIPFSDVLRSGVASPDVQANLSEQERKVIRALAELHPAKREALILRLYAELPYQEIARVLEAPVGTIKFRVHEAIQDLARILGESESRQQGTGS